MRTGQGSRPARGFTYLMLLWWVAISGIVLAALGQSWAIEARRQREMELVFRGQQMVAALQSYYDASPGVVKTWPTRIEDLLEDGRGPVIRRHLRQWWPDPITGRPDWGLIRQGPYIHGVYSPSRQAPLRAPPDVQRYDQWRFEP
ncbi:MAG: type II secretion system protein [Burkholderiales bacterium]|nr:type II secretion system protein [Burkholderiales bacterium]